MSLNFNVSPYYDDFDPTKNYHRILFKPGVAVQARELTQSQTILQDQVSKFGAGLYADGSKISGGNITVDNNIVTAKIVNTDLNIANYTGLYIVGATSGYIGLVVQVDTVNFYVATKQISVGTNIGLFSSGEVLNLYSSKSEAFASLNAPITPVYSTYLITDSTLSRTATATYLTNQISIPTAGINVGDKIFFTTSNTSTTVISVDSISQVTVIETIQGTYTNSPVTVTNKSSVNALEVNIDEGVWFTNGVFVYNSASSIVPDLLNAYPSSVVGFEVDESIVDSYSDATLLDPAVGASNYQAPGADRYQITLNMVTKPYLSDQTVANLTTTKFIELVRVNQGTVEDINQIPIFTSVADAIAQSVNDTAGDFTVTPYSLQIIDTPSSSNYFLGSISAGKVYSGGYPIEHLAKTQIALEKARDTSSESNYDLTTYYGNYTKIQNLKGSIINFQQSSIVELHNVAPNLVSSSTKIGTARVRNFSYDSGSNNLTVYKAFLTDVKLANATFANVSSIIVATSNTYSSITFSANTISPSSIVDNNYNSLLFPFPQQNLSNVSNVNYITTRYYNTGNFANGVYTITTNTPNEDFVGGSGVISQSQAKINYILVTTSSSGSYPSGTFIPMDQSNVSVSITNSTVAPGQATFSIGGNFNGTATILATISSTSDPAKSKVLHTSQYRQVNANTLNTPIDVGYSDIYNFDGVFALGNTSFQGTWSNTTSYITNNSVVYSGNVYVATSSSTGSTPATSNAWTISTNTLSLYNTDNGQRDAYYDHGYITNNSGIAQGQVVVVFDYFTHSGGTGYIDVNSYTSAGIDYGNIPSFTSPQYGTTYSLRDVLDFRPRRTDLASTIDTYQLPAPFNNVFTNYSYYLNRIDKIVLQKNGQFKTIRGVSSYLNPIEPADQPNAMTLFTLNYAAYTFNKNNVAVTPTIIKRYSMRDIGLLDKRISNLEYYTSLSLIENQVSGQDVTDSTGQNLLFKNGFLVDGFTGSSVADVSNPDYAASIDNTNNFARPLFLSNVSNYYNDLNQGVFVTSPGNRTTNLLSVMNNIVTFSYNEDILVNQQVATETININPFNVMNWYGTVNLTPSSDVWYDTQTQPIINVVNEDQSAWIAAVNSTGNGSQWNDWQINWTGQNIVSATNTTQITQDTQAISQVITSQGLSAALTSGPIQVSSTSSVVSNSIIPYARSIPVSFNINGLAPYTTLHTFLDRNNVDLYTLPSAQSTGSVWKLDIVNPGAGYTNGNNQSIITFIGANTVPAIATANVVGGQIVNVNLTQFGSGYSTTPTIKVSGSSTTPAALVANTSIGVPGLIVTDQNGSASGTINIPNDTMSKIPTGSILVEFSDNPLNPSFGTNYAFSTFYAQGTLNTVQTTVVSTRPPSATYSPPAPTPQVIGGASSVPTATGGYWAPDTLTNGSTIDESTGINEATTAVALLTEPLLETSYNSEASTMANVYYANWLTNGGLNNISDTIYSGGQIPLSSVVSTGYSVISTALQVFGPNVTQDQIDGLANTVTVENQDWAQSGPGTANQATTNYAAGLLTSSSGGFAQSVIGASPNSIGNSLDPLSQNFFISATTYPNGVFLSSMDLFFATRDTSIPVSIRIRPTVNGYPSATNDVPGSIVWKNPYDINTPTPGNISTNSVVWISDGLSPYAPSLTLSQGFGVLTSFAQYVGPIVGLNSVQISQVTTSAFLQQVYNYVETIYNGNPPPLTACASILYNVMVNLNQGTSLSSQTSIWGTTSDAFYQQWIDRNIGDKINQAEQYLLNSVNSTAIGLLKTPAASDNATNGIGPATTFTFDNPIYLAPGQYSVMITSNSNNYTLYASKQGQIQYGTQKTVTSVTYAGALFKSQNSSTWIPAAGETLCFAMRICNFAGGNASFGVKSNKANTAFTYDLMNLTNQDLSFTNLDSIAYSVSTKDATSLTMSGQNSITPNQNHNFATRQIESAYSDIVIQSTLNNNDVYTSPVVDLERLNTILVQNIITPYNSANTVIESLPGFGNSGGASARYITRRVTLNNNFASTGLTVYVDVNRQPGTKIEVYYKVLNSIDANGFDNQNYVLMNPILTPGSGVTYTGPDDWTTDTYQSLNIQYNDITTGTLYKNFNVFAIKVCFYSDNPAIVPEIRNFRAIATA